MTHRTHTNREPLNSRQQHPRTQASYQRAFRQVRQVRQVRQPEPMPAGPKATGNNVAFYVIFLALLGALGMWAGL
mgnify:FL=1